MKNEEKYPKLLFLSELQESEMDIYHKKYQAEKIEKVEQEFVAPPKKWKKSAIVVGIVLPVLLAAVLGGKLSKTEVKETAMLETNKTSEDNSTTTTVTKTSAQTVEKTDEEIMTEEMRQEYEEFLTCWAEAFIGRDAETLMKLSSESAWEQMGFLHIEDSYCSFGWSSPWPIFGNELYEILSINATEAELRYCAGCSNRDIEVWREKVKFERKEGELKVVSDDLKFFDIISNLDEYMEAYPEGNISGTMMDYEYNGLGESLNKYAMLYASDESYKMYFNPLTAAQTLLNITTDSTKVRIFGEKAGEETLVHIQFLRPDGMIDEVNVVMHQPYGKYGIWIVK